MELTHRLLCLSLACLTCIFLEADIGEATYVPTSCLCPVSNKHVKFSLIEDFSITEKGPHCNTDTIIVKLSQGNLKVCLNPEGKQGQGLLACWKRINEDESQKKTCLRRKQPL
ncbi:interleukin-8-like [Scleropages formosus]|uniref:interleukin-8-like n=1 Tax=Scleropages formosus TaxID=113540 RepID=UPI000878BC3B|nr:interleukin-8-like [Scleropages formosus]